MGNAAATTKPTPIVTVIYHQSIVSAPFTYSRNTSYGELEEFVRRLLRWPRNKPIYLYNVAGNYDDEQLPIRQLARWIGPQNRIKDRCDVAEVANELAFHERQRTPLACYIRASATRAVEYDPPSLETDFAGDPNEHEHASDDDSDHGAIDDDLLDVVFPRCFCEHRAAIYDKSQMNDKQYVFKGPVLALTAAQALAKGGERSLDYSYPATNHLQATIHYLHDQINALAARKLTRANVHVTYRTPALAHIAHDAPIPGVLDYFTGLGYSIMWFTKPADPVSGKVHGGYTITWSSHKEDSVWPVIAGCEHTEPPVSALPVLPASSTSDATSPSSLDDVAGGRW